MPIVIYNRDDQVRSPNTIYVGKVMLTEGSNEISESDLEIIKGHPCYDKYRESGQLEVAGKSAQPKAKSRNKTKTTSTETERISVDV